MAMSSVSPSITLSEVGVGLEPEIDAETIRAVDDEVKARRAAAGREEFDRFGGGGLLLA
jgi:hypothetical protein